MIAGVSIATLLLVLAAGIGAGFVGYAVGASSLISYPALLAFGIPPVLSNTTNTVGVCGTGIGGLLSARRELRGQGVRVAVYACIGLAGGIIGGLLLLELPAEVFECAVPPLILFSAIIIALNPRKKAAARDAVAQALPQSHQGERAARIASKTASGTLRNDPWWLWVGVSFVGVYSGYFGAAAGTLALAILDLGKIGPFHQINALKTVVGFGANIVRRNHVHHSWIRVLAICHHDVHRMYHRQCHRASRNPAYSRKHHACRRRANRHHPRRQSSAGPPTCDMRCMHLIRKVKSRWKNRFLQRISFLAALRLKRHASRPSVSRKTASCQISVDSARMTMSTSLFSNSRMTCR